MSYHKNKGTDADFLLECSHSTSWAEVAGLTEMTAKACAARFLKLCKQGKAGLGQIPMDVNDGPYLPYILTSKKPEKPC